MKTKTKRLITRGLLPIYLADIFLSIHFGSILYINSSFLGKYFSSTAVSFIFVFGAIASIILFLAVIKLEKLYGNRGFFFFFLFLEILAVFGLAFLSTPLVIALIFILLQSSSAMLLYSLDVFLEDESPEKKTGSIRGVYLTLLNLAILCSPILIAIFAPNGEFTRLYMVSAVFLIPLFLLGVFSFKNFKDGQEKFTSLPITHWWRSKNIRRVSFVRLTLNIFFSLMTIYMPIYLYQYIGFSWTEISFIFTIMLVPFVLFQIPVGWMADKWFGEKEFMTLGLFIMGTALLVIPFLKEANFVYWASLLFFSRIGASIVEISTESYFFKKVNKHDLGLIGIFRLTHPFGYIIGPLLAVLTLQILPFEVMFMFLGLFVFRTMSASVKIQDTL